MVTESYSVSNNLMCMDLWSIMDHAGETLVDTTEEFKAEDVNQRSSPD